jgi:hypothetical protein
MRKLFFILPAFVLLIALFAIYQLWQNNRIVDAPSRSSISASLEKGIGWLVTNRKTILGQSNPMLWWFVKESADITRDERLEALFSEYKKRYLDPYPKNVWWLIFDNKSEVPIPISQLKGFPDYNLYFIYAASCSRELAKQEIIQRQNDPEFCSTYYPLSPACVTHQLMGVRFAQRSHCLDPQTLQTLTFVLQNKIINQLVWDPRVVDVYIQRLLMLAESGRLKEIKPVWLQRMLDAQLVDGGWGGFYPLFPISRTYSVGFTSHHLHLRNPGKLRSNFHTTAQGVFLLSLVKSEWDRENSPEK